MRGATSHDVARAAGVTQSTVSRALRDDPRIPEATRERVRAAAASLAYVPSLRGRSLSTRSTGLLAVVVSDIGNPFYMEALDHLHAALPERERLIVLTDASDAAPASADRLLDGSVDGAILMTTTLDSPLPADLAARGLPTVLFNRTVDDDIVDSCESENAAGAADVARQLLRDGHETIGALGGPVDTSTGRDRERGLRETLAAAGRPLAQRLVQRGPFTHAAGHAGLTALMAQPSPPTAIACANDVIAFGALNAARGLGLSVPGDLTIFGFDDIAMADWEVFQLSTVRQDLASMAQTTLTLLHERIAQPDLPARRVRAPTELVLRASHGPAR
jgi:LacI family transcriptional regulator